MVTKICWILSTFMAISMCHDEDAHTLKLTGDNFDEEISNKNYFVMFYAPWCGHCKNLSPTWEQLAEMLNIEDSNVKIGKVDCTENGDLCNKHDVTGYPTLKFFKIGKTGGEKFRGTRDLPTLTNFINEQTDEDTPGEKEEKPVLSKSHYLVELTEDNFEKFVSSGKHFVKFYAPWCGHCQRLAPVWNSLALLFESDDSVSVGKIDCTQHKSICTQFDVKGYPTLLWLEDGKMVDKYQDKRTLESLNHYVKSMLGSREQTSEEKAETAEEVGYEPVISITGDIFSDIIEDGLSFVKFFAPWCGHCKRLAPTWEALGEKLRDNSDVRIAKVDCTLEVNKDLCSREGVEGFPTLFMYKNGDKISEYSGNRALEDLHEFVVKHFSSHDEL